MKPDEKLADPATVLSNLAEILYEHATFDKISAALCVASTMLIPGCSRASLMMFENGRYVTAASSDPIAASIDALELSLGEGPCLDAIDDETPQLEQDLASRSQWPNLAKEIVRSTPVRSALALRIKTGTAKSGAMNLFSDERDGFTDESIDAALIVAAFASVLISARMQREEAETLRGGLARSREIGKALGLLMATHNVDDDSAFELLKHASQHTNTKIAELARHMVDQHHQLLRDDPQGQLTDS